MFEITKFEDILEQKNKQDILVFNSNWNKLSVIEQNKLLREGITISELIELKDEYIENIIMDLAVNLNNNPKAHNLNLNLESCIQLANKFIEDNKETRFNLSNSMDKGNFKENFIKEMDKLFWES